jgi:uncharacterized membrane protein
MDEIISNMLRFGVLTAACLVLLGGVMYLFQHPGPMPSYRHFHGEPLTLRDPVQIFLGAIHGRASGMIQLGLLVLILTPIARVFMCVVGFFSQRDRLYVTVSLVVLAVLLYSLVFGH